MIKSQPATIRNFNTFWNELNMTGDFTEAERKKSLKMWLKHETATGAETAVEAMLRGAK